MLLACPTCNALARATEEGASAKPGADQVEDGDFLRDGLAVLTPCFLVSFEDGQPPPVYVDENAAKGGIKPRYRLVQGVGPAGLELDRSRTGEAAQAEPAAVRGSTSGRYRSTTTRRRRARR